MGRIPDLRVRVQVLGYYMGTSTSPSIDWWVRVRVRVPTHGAFYISRSIAFFSFLGSYCPACRTYEIATRFWVLVICRIYMCLTVFEFSFILFDLCLFITIFNFILNYVLIVTFWIFTYYKISNYVNYPLFYMKLLNFLFCNMFGSVLECYELTGASLLWPWLIKGK